MRTPGSPLATSASALVAEANAVVPPISIEEAAALLDDESVLFVDIREPKELEREGMIPGAFKAPRGMLEFWVDPASPYYRADLDSGRRLVLYCGSAWRSALAAEVLHRMGYADVTHIDGGFSGWKKAGHPTVMP
ncbi:MAG TPA: rhodanese-like domain-containing protein [Tessaracoccus flavescens]|uniref:Rhodanese-like domain-containing protein n=1 Tax=Tessaracoccus flavescens TaxID=399497 RepID=A0A921EQL7_9ACTN|nr:rhodanese-like domain-containing protein [Tessaracoccus flavescens]